MTRAYTLLKRQESGTSPERFTPAWLMARASMFLGWPYIDPCPASSRPFNQRHVDGLSYTWTGRVWLNPPYGSACKLWVNKLLNDPIEEALLLIPAATDTVWFSPLWQHTICFIRGRIKFQRPDGSLTTIPIATVLIYIGPRVDAFIDCFSVLGPIVRGGPSDEPTLWR